MKNILIFGFILSLSFFSCKKSEKEKQEEPETLKKETSVHTTELPSLPNAEEQKSKAHESLLNLKKTILIIETKEFRIRIDELSNGKYRYASWSINSKMTEKPSLIIKNGNLIPEGSGGNHRYEFTNGNHKYICDINVLAEDDIPDAYLRVLKDGKEILHESGKIKKNEGTPDEENLIPAPSSPGYADAFGEYLLKNETIGGLKIGSSIKEVIKLLGKPEKKEESFFSDAIEMYQGGISYPSKGLSLGLIGKNEKDLTIDLIKITKPSTLKTSKGIGIGLEKKL